MSHHAHLEPSQDKIEEAYEKLRSKFQLLPVKCSKTYRALIDEEISALGGNQGPLRRAMLPSLEKVELRGPGETPDFIDDRSQMPEGSHGRWLHKYFDRVLFFPTFKCLSNCMYCFRQDILDGQGGEGVGLNSALTELIAYLRQHDEVQEVILSGGDPLMLPPTQLELVFSRLASETNIQRFRVHTRAPVFDPRSMTAQHCVVLAKFQVRTFLHVIHPYELTTALKNKCKEADAAGVRLYNHFPLLRQVNDHVDVLTRLIETLDELRVRTVSVYFPEPVMFSGTYRISFGRLLRLIDDFQHHCPSWLHSIRFCQDTARGKCQLHELDHIDESRGVVVFNRGSQKIEVPDFPIELDQPGKIEHLLWKG
jgi:lysine 2,3-aminomutase